MDNEFSDEENDVIIKRFEKLLDQGHYIYHKVENSNKGDKHFYMIYNIDLDQLKKFGSFEQFNQELFFFCEPMYDKENQKMKIKVTQFKKKSPRKIFREGEVNEYFIDGSSFVNGESMIEICNNIRSANEKYEIARNRIIDFDNVLNEIINPHYVGSYHWLRRALIINTIKKDWTENDEKIAAPFIYRAGTINGLRAHEGRGELCVLG